MAAQTPTRSLIDFALPINGTGTRIARDIAVIILFSFITAGFARFVVHLPFTPVPITGQTLAVLLAGAALGSRRGATSMALYAIAGSQLDFFAGGSNSTAAGYSFEFTSGTSGLVWDIASGGYIIGFIPAAFIVGFLCERGWDQKSWIMVAMLAGNATLYVPGLLQLAFFVPDDKVFEYGLYPFIAGDLIKLYIAAVTVPLAWKFLNLKKNRDEPWT